MKSTTLSRALCVGFLICAASIISARAQATIEYSALGDNILIPSGAVAPTGDAVRLGTFPTSYDFAANQNFSDLNAAFTQLDSTTFSAPGHFDDAGVQTAVNQRLYIWAFDTATPGPTAGWVILTNPSWVVPATPGDFLPIDTSDIGTGVPTGARGFGVTSSINNPLGNQTDWRMQAVPEPSTYALLGCGVIGFLAFRFARRRASA